MAKSRTKAKLQTKPERKKREDGREAMLLYLDPKVVKSLKKAAVDKDMHAYEIAELAIGKWLDANIKG